MNLEQQVLTVIRLLEGKRLDSESPPYKTALGWIRDWPSGLTPGLRDKLINTICQTFTVERADIFAGLEGVDRKAIVNGNHERHRGSDEILRPLLPRGGWFEWYDEFTQFTESPLSYHIFSSFAVLGAALGRRTYLDMGHFNIYPNYPVVLIGPPGYVAKTSAAEIARKFVKQAALCPILADKITPESMGTALKASGHHFIYAGELAVFFGKQQYLQSLTTQMLRLLDSPAEFEIQTQARGTELIQDIALTMLGCTTPSLLASSMPQEVSSNGFLSRFTIVYEDDTARIFPRSRQGPHEEKLLAVINRLKAYAGKLDLIPAAERFYESWYHQWWREIREVDETSAEIRSRERVHILRHAMLIHLAQCDNLQICESCISSAAKLMQFLSQNLPQVLRVIKQTGVVREADTVYEALIRMGGAVDHSNLMRRSRMPANVFKQHIRTLEEQGRIRSGKQGGGTYYIATGVTDEL